MLEVSSSLPIGISPITTSYMSSVLLMGISDIMSGCISVGYLSTAFKSANLSLSHARYVISVGGNPKTNVGL